MLKQTVAIVTGSTSGIGLGIATELAASGADVMLNGFGDATAIDSIAHGLEGQYGVRTSYSSADVSKPEAIRELVANTRNRLGPVDILVNNAGIQHVAPVEEFPEEKWN